VRRGKVSTTKRTRNRDYEDDSFGVGKEEREPRAVGVAIPLLSRLPLICEDSGACRGERGEE